MKSLNLNKHLFDRVDNIIWQNNPFYCQPPFHTWKESVSFRTMCEDALTFLADMCVQRCSSSKLGERKLSSSVKESSYNNYLADRNTSFLIDENSCSEMGRKGKFEKTVNLEDVASYMSKVGLIGSFPSFLSSSRTLVCCNCDCHQADIFILRSDGNLFFNVNGNNIQPETFNKPNKSNSYENILTDLDDLIAMFRGHSPEDSFVNFENLKQELMSVFEEFDSLNNVDSGNVSFNENDKSTDDHSFECYNRNQESCLVLIPCNAVTDNFFQNSASIRFTDLKSRSLFLKLNEIHSASQSNNSNLEHNDNIVDLDCKAALKKQGSEGKEQLPAVLEANSCLGDSNHGSTDSDENKSCAGSELCIRENLLPRDEVSGSENRWKRIARYFEPIDSERLNEETVLQTVPEEEELNWINLVISDTSDIVYWKELLWRSALDDCEDDWFQATSLEQHNNIDQWFSSTDNEGRVYFFEENTNKSSWTLPESPLVNNDEGKSTDFEQISSSSVTALLEKHTRYKKSKSMILGRSLEQSLLPNLAHNWPQLTEGTMCVLKEGPLNKTKITENGKRVRKNWTSTYAVLTELQLLFFKDNKGFPSMMSGQGRPELSVDLNGAVIDPGDKVSSRKNVYMLNTVLGLQVLIQSDCAATTDQWIHAIQNAIYKLPSSFDGKSPRAKSESPFGEEKARLAISRSKSLLKYKSASIEDISVNVAERQTKIKERLKKFFNRRPTVEQLVKKGIWKDEPVFGCLLENVSPNEAPRVPEFVKECIRCIESSEENMKTDGLYRASGNLSQVQKIRLQVDQNMYSLLREEDDVHVLAGTLKLFFRELKQPLIPFKFFKKALNASTNQNRKEKIKDFRDIARSLPLVNHDTLKFLLQHLLRVTEYQEFNRMHIPNIAIVFGPTLMWPEEESLNMAFDLMQQNLVIECFLSEFKAIFP